VTGTPGPTQASLSTSVPQSASLEPAPAKQTTFSMGAIVGIAAGGVAVLAAIVGVVLCCRPRSQYEKVMENDAPQLRYTLSL
jgi:hypothetical protein